jgi:hypothetical protein
VIFENSQIRKSAKTTKVLLLSKFLSSCVKFIGIELQQSFKNESKIQSKFKNLPKNTVLYYIQPKRGS